jgi:hypothetical protein
MPKTVRYGLIQAKGPSLTKSSSSSPSLVVARKDDDDDDDVVVIVNVVVGDVLDLSLVENEWSGAYLYRACCVDPVPWLQLLGDDSVTTTTKAEAVHVDGSVHQTATTATANKYSAAADDDSTVPCCNLMLFLPPHKHTHTHSRFNKLMV